MSASLWTPSLPKYTAQNVSLQAHLQVGGAIQSLKNYNQESSPSYPEIIYTNLQHMVYQLLSQLLPEYSSNSLTICTSRGVFSLRTSNSSSSSSCIIAILHIGHTSLPLTSSNATSNTAGWWLRVCLLSGEKHVDGFRPLNQEFNWCSGSL